MMMGMKMMEMGMMLIIITVPMTEKQITL